MTCVRIHASLCLYGTLSRYLHKIIPRYLEWRIFSFFVRNGLAHVRVANDLRSCSIGLLHLQLFASNRSLSTLVSSYLVLPTSMSGLGPCQFARTGWFSNKSGSHVSRRVYAFPHLRKSITSQLPATIISKAGGLMVSFFGPLWVVFFYSLVPTLSFNSRFVACSLSALNAAHVAVLRSQPYSTIFLVSSNVALDHFEFPSQNIQA